MEARAFQPEFQRFPVNAGDDLQRQKRKLDQARAKVLHEQMRASMKDTKAKMAGVLTTEQRAKAEELVKDRKANLERRGGGRRGFPGKRGPGAQPPQKPANPPANE